MIGTRVSDLAEVTAVENDDYLLMVSQVRTAGGTRKIKPQNLMKTGGKLLTVDGTNGSDTYGTRGSNLAYATLTAAKAAAVSGDTIIVMPGTYAENNLLKNGVNWHFIGGAVVRYVNTVVTGSDTVYGIFDDRDAACICKVTGGGEFFYEAGYSEGGSNTTIKGAIHISNAASSVSIHGRSINLKAHFGDILVYAIRVEDCTRVVIDVPEILDTGFGVTIGSLPSTACGILYRWGEVFVNADIIKMGYHSVHAVQKSNPSGQGLLYVKSGQINGYQESPAVGTFNDIWIQGGTTDDFRTVIECGQGITGESDHYVVNGGGIHSIEIETIVTEAAAALFNIASDDTGVYDPKVNIRAGHLKTAEYFILCGINSVGSPQVTAQIDNGETTGHMLRCLRGEANVRGGIWRRVVTLTHQTVSRARDTNIVTLVTATPHGLITGSAIAVSGVGGTGYNVTEADVVVIDTTTIQYEAIGPDESTTPDTGGTVTPGGSDNFGVSHEGGVLRLQGVTVDTSLLPGATNHPIRVSASGLILDGCKVLATALGDTISGTATIKVYGQTFLNTAKAGTITVQVGTLTTDSNVT